MFGIKIQRNLSRLIKTQTEPFLSLTILPKLIKRSVNFLLQQTVYVSALFIYIYQYLPSLYLYLLYFYLSVSPLFIIYMCPSLLNTHSIYGSAVIIICMSIQFSLSVEFEHQRYKDTYIQTAIKTQSKCAFIFIMESLIYRGDFLLYL